MANYVTTVAYVLLHHARLTWPCLSFDVLRDVGLPLTYLCIGDPLLSDDLAGPR